MIFLGSSSWAQNLDKMSESERTDALVRIAKEAVLKIGPDFYREYGKPGIEHSYVTDDNRESTVEESKKYNGRSFYMVKFFYDKSKESFPKSYAAKVYIWGDTGKAYCVLFGGGLGQEISDESDTESATKFNWTWEKQPPGKFRTTRAIKQEYNPQKEYIRGNKKRDGDID